MASNKPLKLLTPALQWVLSKIRPGQRQQVEGDQDRGGAAGAAPESPEITVAVRSKDDGLTVQKGGIGRERSNRPRDLYEVFGEIPGLTRPKPNLVPPLQSKESIAVMLQLMKPSRPTWGRGH